jgi:hypothetical protein
MRCCRFGSIIYAEIFPEMIIIGTFNDRDGNAPVGIARDGTSGGVPLHAFTNGLVSTADQLFTYHLYIIIL